MIFLILTILVGMKWSSIGVLICISLTAILYMFVVISHSFKSSWWNVYLKLFPLKKNYRLHLLFIVCLIYKYFLTISGFFFIFFMVSFEVQKDLILKSSLQIFKVNFGVVSQNFLPNWIPQSFFSPLEVSSF